MARNKYVNYDENLYVHISIKKSSYTYKKLMEEADFLGIKRRKLHDLIVARLGDYYRIVTNELPDDDMEGELAHDTTTAG